MEIKFSQRLYILIISIFTFPPFVFGDVAPSDPQELVMIYGDTLGSSLFADYVRKVEFQIEKSDQNLLNDLAFRVKTTGSELGVATFDQGSPVDLAYSRAPEKFYVDPQNLRRLLSVPTSEVRFTGIQELGSFIPPLFFGYTKAIDELQVISFNKNTKEYEFLVINNYGTDKKAEMFRPKRKFCISCHQSGTPHFSRRPWKTTVFGNENLLAETEGEGLELAAAAASFDSSIQESAEALQALRVCDTACPPEDLACKKRLLSYVFIGPKVKRENHENQARYYRFFNNDFKMNFSGTWPEDDYSYPSNVITQYDPTKTETDYYLFSQTLDPSHIAETFYNFNGSRPGKDHSLFYAQLEKLDSEVAFTYLTEFRGTLDFEEVANRVDGLNRHTIQDNIHGTGLENPVSLRPHVGHIPLDFAPEALMKAGNLGACHFMHEEQIYRFNRRKSIEQIYNYFMNDPKVEQILSSHWPLTYDQINDLVRSTRNQDISEFPIHLNIPSQETEMKQRAQEKISELASDPPAVDLGPDLPNLNCGSTSKYLIKGAIKNDFDVFKNELRALESTEKSPWSREKTIDVIQRSCGHCHDPAHDKTILPVSLDLYGLKLWGTQYDRENLTLEKIACMNMPPAIFKTKPHLDHGTPVMLTPEERANIVYWLKREVD